MNRISTLGLMVAAIGLSGCATAGLSAEQLKAMEGQSSSVCFRAPGWNGSQVEIHYTSFGGKSTGTAGGGGKATCGTSTAEFSNEGRALNPPKAASAP